MLIKERKGTLQFGNDGITLQRQVALASAWCLLRIRPCNCPSRTLGSDYNAEGHGDGLTPHSVTASHAVDVPDSTAMPL